MVHLFRLSVMLVAMLSFAPNAFAYGPWIIKTDPGLVYSLSVNTGDTHAYRMRFIQTRTQALPSQAGDASSPVCNYFFMTATDSMAPQKFQMMLSSILAERWVFFSVDYYDGPQQDAICHFSDISFLEQTYRDPTSTF